MQYVTGANLQVGWLAMSPSSLKMVPSWTSFWVAYMPHTVVQFIQPNCSPCDGHHCYRFMLYLVEPVQEWDLAKQHPFHISNQTLLILQQD